MEPVPPVLEMSKRYHRAKFPLTLRSLEEFLSKYEANSHDESLEDPIAWCSQDDHFRSVALPLPPVQGIFDVLKLVPVICRTITLCKPVIPGMNMNPWLGRILTLPTILRFMSTSDFLRFKDKRHDKEIINCAMLVTKNPSGSILAYGAGKHISSVLLTGDPAMYHPDADLATWAMVVIHILTQPSQASWMQEELCMIDDMHRFVYRDPRTSWAKYLRQVRSEDFRLSLVTHSPQLPPWSQCPHLNKFLLACFFLRRELEPFQMEERRNAAIMEFFGRVYKPELLTTFYEGQFAVSVEEVLSSIPFELKITLRDTIKCFSANLDRYDFKSMPIRILEPTQETVRNSYMNLCCATIVNFFRNICPEIPDLEDSTWRKLLLTGMHVQDSYKRNTNAGFELSQEKLVAEIRSRFKCDVKLKAPTFVMSKYQSIMLLSHTDLPVIVSKENNERFRQKHGRDLRQELEVNDFGLSRVACMCPKCPFFAKPFGRPSVPHGMNACLQEHINSFVPGLHKAIYTHHDKSTADIMGAIIRHCMVFRVGEDNVRDVINTINNIRQHTVEWEVFEKHFV